jgi:hypothetical protein
MTRTEHPLAAHLVLSVEVGSHHSYYHALEAVRRTFIRGSRKAFNVLVKRVFCCLKFELL